MCFLGCQIKLKPIFVLTEVFAGLENTATKEVPKEGLRD